MGFIGPWCGASSIRTTFPNATICVASWDFPRYFSSRQGVIPRVGLLDQLDDNMARRGEAWRGYSWRDKAWRVLAWRREGSCNHPRAASLGELNELPQLR